MLAGKDGPRIEEDDMHPSITQALAAERVSEWRKAAAKERLARQALRPRRRAAAQAAAEAVAEAPARRDARRRGALAAAVTDERAGAADDRQPACNQAV